MPFNTTKNELNFSDYLFGAKKPRNKHREFLLRNLRKIKSKMDTISDPFWFDYQGYKFWYIKHYRDTDIVILTSDIEKRIDLNDLNGVKFLGYVRQRLESHGSVDFYTHDKSIKNELRRNAKKTLCWKSFKRPKNQV